MREGGVRVRAAVDGATRVRDVLAVSSGHDAENRKNYSQHQDQTCYSNGDGKRSLGHAQRVIRRLLAGNGWAIKMSET